MKFKAISPHGIPPNPILFPTFKPTFESRGNVFVDSIQECDIVLLDLHSRIADYNQEDIDWILKFCPKIVTFDEWDRGNMSTDEWPHPLTPQQEQIFKQIAFGNIKAVHFSRLLDKTKKYPFNVYPFEKPIIHEENPPLPNELFNREYDVCFIANSAPSRIAIAQALENDTRLKCDISIGEPKIPFNDFVARHKRAKLFVSSAAGGFTDERKQALFSIAGVIWHKTDQLMLHQFTDENCIEIDSPPTKEQLDTICEIVNDGRKLWQLYQNGYFFMKKYYTEEYIAGNILETILKHL